jgi:PmbA protein
VSTEADHDLLALAERVVAGARPGEELEVFVGRSQSTNVKAYDGAVEAFSSAQSMGVGIRVIVDGRQGFAYAGTLDEDVIATTLADARDNVRYSERDEFVALARPDGVVPVDQELWMDEVLTFPNERKIDLAIELERRVRHADPRIFGIRTSSFADSAGESAVATSTGIASYGRATFCSLSITALARDNGETTAGGGYDLARRPSELDLGHAADDAVLRATRLLGATKPASQRITVVLEPRLASIIMGIVGGTLGGDVVTKKRTPFADRVGDVIASPLLSIIEDPTDPRSFSADSHDGEGLACRPTSLISAGVLQGFLHNTYTARRMGVTSTASAVRGVRSTPGVGAVALQMTPGAASAAELLASIDSGIFVQSLSGLHSGVNAVSGDFSVGVEGLMIRNGALAEPVREATLGSTIQRLLTDIVAVGSDLEWLPGGYGAATLVIDGVTLSGA